MGPPLAACCWRERRISEWLAHGDPRRPSQARDPLSLPSWRALPLPPLLEGVAENVAPARGFGLFPDMERAGSAELAPSSAWPRPCSGILPREDKATAIRVLSRVGEALGSRGRGRPFLRLIRKVSGLRRYRPGRRWWRHDERGPLAETRPLHIPACVRSRHGALRQAAFRVARPWRRRCRLHKDHEKDVRAEICRAIGREEGSRRRMFVG